MRPLVVGAAALEDVSTLLARWQISSADVREQIYRAKTARERERWHALWLLSRGWPAAQVAQALERDAHTIGDWLTAFAQDGPAALAFEQSGGSPPPSSQSSKPR
ncbi:MAG TPA: helix-turn-helix domain-containing protein [Ktedonobacterales bacterium]|nr:helix-turn-helix domain-containing protein [Ktedonobacterales bacterium]